MCNIVWWVPSFTVLALFKWHSTEISLLKTSKCILSMDSQYYVNLLYYILHWCLTFLGRLTKVCPPTVLYKIYMYSKNNFFQFLSCLLLILCIYLYSMHYYIIIIIIIIIHCLLFISNIINPNHHGQGPKMALTFPGA